MLVIMKIKYSFFSFIVLMFLLCFTTLFQNTSVLLRLALYQHVPYWDSCKGTTQRGEDICADSNYFLYVFYSFALYFFSWFWVGFLFGSQYDVIIHQKYILYCFANYTGVCSLCVICVFCRSILGMNPKRLVSYLRICTVSYARATQKHLFQLKVLKFSVYSLLYLVW